MSYKEIHTDSDLDHLLAADAGYEIGGSAGYVPTNVEEVINSLILRIENDISFRIKFRNALVTLSKKQTRGWLVMYYLVEIASWSKVHQQEIIEDIDLVQIGENLENNRENFSNDRSWNGYQYVDGLWGDVKRLNNNLKKFYGKTILKSDV